MRVLEIDYAAIRNWACDYSKLAMRLLEIGYATTRNWLCNYSKQKRDVLV